MKIKLLFLLLCNYVAINCYAQTLLFEQNFETSNTVEDFVDSVSGNNNQFNGLTTDNSSITNGTLSFSRSSASGVFAYKNLIFSEKPTFVELQFDFELFNYTVGTQSPTFSILVGSNFTSTALGALSDYTSRFGISGENGTNQFKVSTVDNIGGSPTSGLFEGKQKITFLVNNTNNQQTYTAPDGSTQTLDSKKMVVWVGNTRPINNFSLKRTSSPEGDITGFKFQATSKSGNGTFTFDNITFKDLLDSSVVSGSQSLVHPHIWVKSEDKQQILNNIANYNWANNLFTDLKNRNDTFVNNHINDPAAVLSTIPNIPGNRTQHRTRLDIGVESAMLYYLTDEEKYAQIAADILHNYVQKIKDISPQSFQFYAPSFNHLIQCRELFTRVAIIFDFVQPFISKTESTVYDFTTGTRIDFNFTNSDKAFAVLAENVLSVGANDSNHPVLELPGGLYSAMCIQDDATRDAYMNRLINNPVSTGQPGVNWMINRFSAEDRLWPESAGYGKFTHALFIQLMNIIDNYDPELKIVENNRDIIESIFLYENYLYPNGKTIAYGDIGRIFVDHGQIFRSVMKIADRKGYTGLKERAATTLQKIYTEAGGYAPTIFSQRLEWNNPLELLWGIHIDESVPATGEPKYSTIKATHAGMVMQRNFSGVDDEKNGLMYYTAGGTYVHANADGLDMEFYGRGYIMAPDFGGYQTPLEFEYASGYAAHNTIIVNGTSGRGPKTNGNSSWQNLVDPIILQAVEPKPYANPIAENFSFSTQFLDDNINNADQQRTNSIIRTSPTTGYYLDVFRSTSTVENNFHDYLFHGIGDILTLNSQNTLLPLIETPERYQNDAGDERKQPGWRHFFNAKTSNLTSSSIAARIDLQATNDYLHINIPAGINREYTSALAPPTEHINNEYDQKDTNMFIMRKYGEAWNEPFIALYEPSGNAISTIKSTNHLYDANQKVVGVTVVSEVDGKTITDYILSNDNNQETINLPNLEINFSGRFGIVRVEDDGALTNTSLYIGEGQQLTYQDKVIFADNEGKAYQTYEDTPTLSVNEINSNEVSFSAYPNPTQDALEIKLPENLTNIVKIDIYDINAKLVDTGNYNAKNGKLIINTSNYANGVFFIKLNTATPKFLKFVKK